MLLFTDFVTVFFSQWVTANVTGEIDLNSDLDNSAMAQASDMTNHAGCDGVGIESAGPLEPLGNSSDLLEAYEELREALPHADFPDHFERFNDLEALTERYDVFFFDAFGVLNIGETAIKGAAERVSAIRRTGRQVRIVSNAGSVPLPALHEKYERLGFDFSPDEIVSSRLPMLHYLRDQPARVWGVMAPVGADTHDLGVEAINLSERPECMDDVEGFILLSAAGWTENLQHRLTASLKKSSRPVLLANPDLAAPRENGFSVEPGQLAHALKVETACTVIGFGKPYPSIFDIALEGLDTPVKRDRVLMIGDTLHTDVLGGCSAGLATALVTAQGASAALDWNAAIHATGIMPNYVLDHI